MGSHTHFDCICCDLECASGVMTSQQVPACVRVQTARKLAVTEVDLERSLSHVESAESSVTQLL